MKLFGNCQETLFKANGEVIVFTMKDPSNFDTDK